MLQAKEGIRYFKAYLENISVLKYYLVLSFTFSLVTLVFYFPDLDLYKENAEFYERVNRQIEFPFEPDTYNSEGGIKPNNHFNKRVFRLTVPLIARVLHLNSHQIFWGQFLLLPLFFYLLARIFLKITKSRISAFLLTFSFCFIYPAKSFGFYMPLYDCFAYLLLAALFLSESFVLSFFLLVLISFSDERALIASFFILLFKSTDYSKGFFATPKTYFLLLTGLLAYGSYFAVRYYLSYSHGLQVTINSRNGVGLEVIKYNFGIAPFALFQLLEGWWILFLYVIYLCVKLGKPFVPAVFSLSILCSFLAGIAVGDVTRSVSYGFVAVFPMTAFFFQTELNNKIKKYVPLFVCLACAIIPTYLIWGGEIIKVYWLSPILPKAFKYLF